MHYRGPLAGLVLFACVPLLFAQNYEGRLKPPLTKAEQDRKFHSPEVVGTSAHARLDSYRKRLQMEAASPFQGLKWRSIGPERQGGRVVDIASPKNLPNVLYVAYATGGLWRTEDDGNSWTPLFDHESAFSIGSIAVSNDGKTLWIGTGENNSQRTSYSGMGVFKSSDAGKTWVNTGLAETHRIGKLLVDPRDANVVYVGALGPLYSSSNDRGVYKTSNGGNSWERVLPGGAHTGVIDMQMDPKNPDVLYAAMWDKDRRAWDFREGGAGSAVYKSVDAGKTWHRLANGWPNTPDMGRIGLAIAPSRPSTIYAFIDNQAAYRDTMDEDEFQPTGVLTPRRFALLSEEEFLQVPKDDLRRFFDTYGAGLDLEALKLDVKSKKRTMEDIRAQLAEKNPGLFQEDQVLEEVYRSDDAGGHWKRTMTTRMGEHGGYYWGKVFVSPVNPEEVYTCGVELLRSQDGGKTWKAIADEAHGDFHVYYIDPRSPRFHATGSDGGIYFSYDSGGHWRHMENMAVGQFTSIAVDGKSPYNVIGGLQDNGTMKGPSTHVPASSDPEEWTYIDWGDGSAVAVDPRDGGDVVYTAAQFGEASGHNLKLGQRWSAKPRGKKGEPPLRYNWVAPFIVSPHHSDIIYFGSQKLHRSLDQGRTWEELSGDLTKNRPDGNVPFSTLKDISESRFKFGVVYIGCDDGTVKVTRDHGGIWEDISTPAKDKWVSRVVASQWDPATVYVAQTGYREDDFTPYLWKSTDYGKHWTSIVGDLPMEPINVVREDPNHKDLLYVGTDMGVFVSYDSGGRWEALCGGIPHVPVHDLAIQASKKELVAATHARSVWAMNLDDVYGLNKELRAKDLAIMPLETMRRSNRWGYGFPSPETQPSLPVHELRVEIWSARGGKAKLRLKDKAGKPVIEKEIVLTPGFNTFALSLEIAPAKLPSASPHREINTVQQVLRDPYEASRPKFISVGTYTLEVTSGGHSATKEWTLEDAGR